MNTVYVHKYAGILSAYGMALADVIHEEQAPCVLKYSEVNKDFFLFLASFMNISYYGQCTYFHVGTSGKITKTLLGFLAKTVADCRGYLIWTLYFQHLSTLTL